MAEPEAARPGALPKTKKHTTIYSHTLPYYMIHLLYENNFRTFNA